MCGRYALTISQSVLAEVFEAADRTTHTPRFNVAPTQTMPVLRRSPEGERVLDDLRWGLVPHWADDLSIGNRLINARSETARSKPAFRAAAARRRCLVPADAFFEWAKADGGKQPYVLRYQDRRPFAFGGLWESWQQDEDSELVRSYTILTTRPNRIAEPVHDRMPVIVAPPAWDEWLDPSPIASERWQELTAPAAAEEMEAVAVSTRVNRPANDDPAVLEPVDR